MGLRLDGRADGNAGTRQRVWTVAASLATLLAGLPAVGLAPGATATPARASDTTISQDTARSGWDSHEPQMSPAAVRTFTQLWARHVTGQVYAQPLVLGSTVIVATEKDYVYGLDATTGAIKWTTKVGTFYHITSCHDVSPDLGVTGGPVYDPGTGDVYVMAQIKPGKHPLYSLFGINPGNGKITESVGVPLHPANASHLRFDAANELARPGLLVLDGWVYAAFGSHCDHTPYVGYVAGVKVATKARTLWSDETGVTDKQAGIWQSGGGLMSDGSGRIFFASGNGVSPAPGAGQKRPPQGTLAESVVRLGKNATGRLFARDFFSPANAPTLDAGDTDWGSGSPVALPMGTATYPDVLAQAGKDGRIFLLNRHNLGGRKQGPGGSDAALSVTSPYHGQWGHPAVFADTATLTAANAASANDYLYYLGRSDSLRILKFGVNGADKPTLADVGNTSVTFGYTSGSPAVTSNGTDPASAVVWAVYDHDPTGKDGALEAFPAVPPGCSAASPCTVQPLNSWPIGIATKFTSVATSGGRVFLGTRTGATSSGGTVYAFGAAPAAAPLAPARQATFAQTPVGATATRTVTLTASSTVTVTGTTATTGATGGNTAAGQFSVKAGKATMATQAAATATPPGTASPAAPPSASPAMPVRFPVTMHKGDTLRVPVTFRPSAPGGATGAVTFTTSAGPREVPLSGTGTTSGLYASQAKVPFALVNDIGQPVSDVPVGVQVPREFNIANGGTRPVTITSVSPPAGPYRAANLPRTGDTLAPGQSVVVQVVFAPRAPGSQPRSLSVAGSDGSTVTVRLSGAGLPAAGLFTAAPRTVDFGRVRVGKEATAAIKLRNRGNEPATIVSTSVLRGPFRRVIRMAPQLPVNAGYDVRAPVAFTPRHRGTFTTTYTFTWSDVTGTHQLAVRLTGTGV